jgi:hypothetical protein
MDTVQLRPNSWSWDCPNCGMQNDLYSFEYSLDELVQCDDCFNRFEVQLSEA